MYEVFTRLIDLPCTINGVTSLDENLDYNIFINARLSAEEQKKAYDHEMRHIRLEHFYTFKSAVECEREVERCE